MIISERWYTIGDVRKRDRGEDVTTETVKRVPEWLSYRDASEYAGLSRGFLYQRIASGELPAYKAGRSIRIRREDLDAFLLRHGVAGIGGD